MLSYSSGDKINKGMFASAQPDATVRSAFWQAIAAGAELFDFSELMVYAPTLLPIPFGKTRMDPAIYFPNRSCYWSVNAPVFLSTEPRKLIGWLDLTTFPVTFPLTIVFRVDLFHPSLFLIVALGLHPNRLSFSDSMRP